MIREVIYVWPFGRDSDVDWQLVLKWTFNGQSRDTVINDHGKPFRPSGEGKSSPYSYDADTRKWMRYP
jgi:hypothetical protein